MSEVYKFSKHENNEKNRKNAAFSFLKNIRLGNEPYNTEKNSIQYEKPLLIKKKKFISQYKRQFQ